MPDQVPEGTSDYEKVARVYDETNAQYGPAVAQAEAINAMEKSGIAPSDAFQDAESRRVLAEQAASITQPGDIADVAIHEQKLRRAPSRFGYTESETGRALARSDAEEVLQPFNLDSLRTLYTDYLFDPPLDSSLQGVEMAKARQARHAEIADHIRELHMIGSISNSQIEAFYAARRAVIDVTPVERRLLSTNLGEEGRLMELQLALANGEIGSVDIALDLAEKYHIQPHLTARIGWRRAKSTEATTDY